MRRQSAEEEGKASEPESGEGQTAAERGTSKARNFPVSVWLPTLDEPTASEQKTERDRDAAETGSATPDSPRWRAISQGAPAKRPERLDDAGNATGQWLPPQLQPEANPLATGAWFRHDEAGPGGFVDSASARLPRDQESQPDAGPASTEPGLNPSGAARPQVISARAPVNPPTTRVTEEGSSVEGDDLTEYGLRARAVAAYCRALFSADAASRRAEQLLHSLSGGISDDKVLLELTRTGVAKLLDGDGTATVVLEKPRYCDDIFGRLAARANGILGTAERSHLQRHLACCLVCKAAELRVSRADRAFAATLGLTLHS